MMGDLHDDAPPWYYDRAIRIPVYSWYHINRVRAVCAEIPSGAKIVVDVGCDGGTLTEFIARCSGSFVIGVDIKHESVSYAARTKAGAEFLAGDGLLLPLRSEISDVVTILEVLEHVENPALMVSEGFRLLKRGGVLIAMIPNTRSKLFRLVWWFWSRTFGRVWKHAHNENFDAWEIERIVVDTGFEIVRKKTINLGMVVLLVVRKP